MPVSPIELKNPLPEPPGQALGQVVISAVAFMTIFHALATELLLHNFTGLRYATFQ